MTDDPIAEQIAELRADALLDDQDAAPAEHDADADLLQQMRRALGDQIPIDIDPQHAPIMAAFAQVDQALTLRQMRQDVLAIGPVTLLPNMPDMSRPPVGRMSQTQDWRESLASARALADAETDPLTGADAPDGQELDHAHD